MEAAVERQAVATVKASGKSPASRARRRPHSEKTIQTIYRKLAREWGAQHWWPAETPFEVIVGAILTQNTSWTNVGRAMQSLRAAEVLSVEGIRDTPLHELERLVRPSGYFRQKARRLKGFVAWVDAKYGGSLEAMFSTATDELRAELLKQNGIGPETADSILLYAGLHAIFVVDAYTRRLLERHKVIRASAKYDEIRELVEGALRNEDIPLSHAKARERPVAHAPSAMSRAQQSALSRVYNEMHGLLVQAGKHYCFRRQPDCGGCPLGEMLTTAEKRRLQGPGDIRKR